MNSMDMESWVQYFKELASAESYQVMDDDYDFVYSCYHNDLTPEEALSELKRVNDLFSFLSIDSK